MSSLSRPLVAVLAVALVLRLVPVAVHHFALDRLATADSYLLLDLAHHLASDGRFERSLPPELSYPESAGPVEVYRTPGYPLLLAALGHLPGGAVPWVVALQVLLGLGLVGFAWVLGQRFGGRRAALVASWIVALDPGQILYSQMVMSDLLFAFLLVAAVVAAIRVGEAGGATLARAAGLGLLLSAATAVRPLAVAALPAILLFLFLRRVPRRAVALALALAFAFPLLWASRNAVRAGVYSLSNAFELNLAVIVVPKILARATGRPRWQTAREQGEELRRELAGLSAAERSERFRARFRETVARHPRAAAMTLLEAGFEIAIGGDRAAWLRLLGAAEAEAPAIGEGRRGIAAVRRDLAGRSPLEVALVAGQAVWNALLWLAAATGLGRLARHRRWAAVTLLAALTGLVLAVSLVVATGRMRLPVTPMLATLAGIAAAGGFFSPPPGARPRPAGR